MIRLFGSIQGLKDQAQGLLLGKGTGGNAGVGDVISGQTFTNDTGQQTGTGANAKRYLTGTITSISGSGFINYNGIVDGANTGKVVVSGLTFLPSLIELELTTPSATFGAITSVTCYPAQLMNTDSTIRIMVMNVGAGGGLQVTCYKIDGSVIQVTSTGFTLPVPTSGVSYTWKAYE